MKYTVGWQSSTNLGGKSEKTAMEFWASKLRIGYNDKKKSEKESQVNSTFMQIQAK